MLTQQPHRQLLVLPKLHQSCFKCCICRERYRREVSIFLESTSKRVRVLEKNSQANSSNLKALETSIERNNLNISSCLSSFKNLKEKVDFLEKTNTKQVPSTINPSNIVLANGPTLINQVKDWKLIKRTLKLTYYPSLKNS